MNLGNIKCPRFHARDLERFIEFYINNLSIKINSVCRGWISGKFVSSCSLTLFFFNRDESGVFISDIVGDSIAAKCGKLRCGDQILAVNGEDLRNASQERAAQALRVCATESFILYMRTTLFRRPYNVIVGTTSYER